MTRLLLLTAFLGAALAAGAAEPPLTPDQVSFFEKNIRPVLISKCYDCHSAKAEKVKGGLLLDTHAATLQGGDNGPAVVPEHPDESLLIKALRYDDKDTQMPPQKSGGKLPAEVIANFEQWVRMGAPDPRDGTAKTVAEMDTEKAKQFWSFQAPRRVEPPAVQDTAWARTGIDHFVLAKMEQSKVQPVPDTEPRALLRRIFFDLIGMPPSMAEADAFLAKAARGPEAQRKAFEAMVDRLLQSPQFGERWGRHWLDVARYGESTGKESNNLFPTAWRYRDYVIDRFNDDTPYDEFIREQIAGDLMPAADSAEYNRHLIATGFLALGTKNIPEKKPLIFEMDMVDEQIDAASRAVLGLTVSCARCHDHKYDPISTRDYYALAGIFRSTHVFYGTHGRKKKGTNASTLLPLADETKSLSEQPQLATVAFVPDPLNKRANKKANKKNRVKFRDESPLQLRLEVMGVRDGMAMDCPIYVKGETDDPAGTVPRGVVKVLCTGSPPTLPSNGSGRLQLAQWLTARDNPLTARVMANRVWQHLFGQGLVRTADNFGATGERPTHPELLDYLATEFADHGWSVKHLIREIVLSHVYQLGTHSDAADAQIDPGNRLLWRANPRRLDAEAIRDAMLTASGLLDLVPPRGSMVASIGDGLASKHSNGFVNAQFHYRSVYLPIVRDFVPECLEVFDFAEPSLVVANRDATNVPSQALYLMNNDFVIEQAKALAHRIASVPGLDHLGRIELAYQYALCRPATLAERARADVFLRDEVKGLMRPPDVRLTAAEAAYTTFCQALFASAEFRYLADSLPNQSAKLP